MAVTGRQRLQVNFMSQHTIAASARATFSRAKSRAFRVLTGPPSEPQSGRSGSSGLAASRCPGHPPRSRQFGFDRACDQALSAAPSVLTSSKSRAYSALVKCGGKTGRNCDAYAMPNGLTSAHCGNNAGLKSGGVGRHCPGCVPGIWVAERCEPSSLRQAMTCPATSFSNADSCQFSRSVWDLRQTVGERSLQASPIGRIKLQQHAKCSLRCRRFARSRSGDRAYRLGTTGELARSSYCVVDRHVRHSQRPGCHRRRRRGPLNCRQRHFIPVKNHVSPSDCGYSQND